MLPDFLCYIPEEDTETSYNKKGLPGNDHNAYNSSPAGRRVGDVVASKVEVYRQDQKGNNQHVKKCRIGFH